MNFKIQKKFIDQNNQPIIDEIIENDQNKDNIHLTNIDNSSIIKKSHFSGKNISLLYCRFNIFIIIVFYVPIYIDSITDSTSNTAHNIFKNGSLVEFCYGTNIDFVYVRNYDQKKIYSKEMKQFYAYYKKSKTICFLIIYLRILN